MTKSLRAWIFTILYRRCLDYLRGRRRSFELLKKIERESARPRLVNPGPSGRPGGLPSPFLQSLSLRERTAVCLWANEGYTSGEISEV
jgi:RNA polymerase sigma-70 factor (ECF subfamily)